MPEKLVTLVKFSDPVRAELAKSHLEEAGIIAFLGGEATVGLFPGMAYALNTIQLHVREADVERARQVLAALAEGVDPEQAGPEESTAITERKPATGIAPAPGLPIDSAFQGGLFLRRSADDCEELEPALVEDQAEADAATDDETPDHSVAYTPEDLAVRALRAAILGWFLCPPLLHLYSLWLLLRLGLMPSELSTAGKWKASMAFALDTLVLVVVAFFLRATWGH